MNKALKLVQLYFPKVTTIRDAKEPITIEVTDHDRFTSKKMDHRECALAACLKRIYKLDGSIISINRAYLIKGSEATRYDIPPSVSREITSFDRGSEFMSGTYRLRAIPKGSRLGATPNKPSGPRVNKKKRPTPHVTRGVRHVLQ